MEYGPHWSSQQTNIYEEVIWYNLFLYGKHKEKNFIHERESAVKAGHVKLWWNLHEQLNDARRYLVMLWRSTGSTKEEDNCELDPEGKGPMVGVRAGELEIRTQQQEHTWWTRTRSNWGVAVAQFQHAHLAGDRRWQSAQTEVKMHIGNRWQEGSDSDPIIRTLRT